MDARTFDRWTASVAHRPTRRAALRLLAGSLVAGLLPLRGVALATAAQRSDRDGDGLYDDDEVEVYGTNPDVYDTDGDGVGDGEEVYVGTDPLTPAGGGGGGLPAGSYEPAPPSYVDPVLDSCAIQGLTNCDGFCVDVSASEGHCGFCGNACQYPAACQGGVCTNPGCAVGQTLCDYCTNLFTDVNHCGACGNRCPYPFVCCGGTCVDISSDVNHCGRCDNYCIEEILGVLYEGSCENFQC